MLQNAIEVKDDVNSDILDKMLAEIATYDIELQEDPTLPNLGIRYLLQSIAICRSYLNRTQFYLQIVRVHERKLRSDLKFHELDLDLKLKQKLADDPLIRKQPSIEDRKALAASLMSDEHNRISKIQVQLLETQEAAKIIKFKYDHLNRTSADLKMQRALVRDDMESRLSGGDGYDRPQLNRNKTVPHGMQAPVAQTITAEDLLDPNKRPEDLPKPIDQAHAGQIAAFLSGSNVGPKKTDIDGKIASDTTIDLNSLLD